MSSLSRKNLAQIASLSSGTPSGAVYLVLPFLIARTAADFMFSGVSKSGSPAPSPITSWPAAFNSAALVDTAMVGDGLTRFSVVDRKDMATSRFELDY